MLLVEQSVRLLGNNTNYVNELEEIARTCYQSSNNGSKSVPGTLLRHIISNKHESILEFQSATFDIITDRGIANELVRHRLASYAQESTRYVKYKSIQFILPEELRDQLGVFSYLEDVEKLYNILLHDNKPEIARSILPLCTKTNIKMQCNLREWRHFLKLRLAKNAHPMMRELARMIFKCLNDNYPIIFNDLEGAYEH